MELSKMKIRVFFANYFKDNPNAVEASRKINEIQRKHATNEQTVRFFFTNLRAVDFSLEDEPGSGRPTVIQDDILRNDPAKSYSTDCPRDAC